MTSTTPLSKDVFASEQLLRAAEQLQDAIKSTRRRRSSHTSRSASMLSSLRTTNTLARSERSATFEDEDAFGDNTISEQDDKENVRYNGLRASSSSAGVTDKVLAARCDADWKQQLSRDRFSRQMTQSMSGEMLLDLASLSGCSDGDESDGGNGDRVRHSNRCSVIEWERRGILRMSELSLSGMSQSDFEPFGSRHMTRSEMDKSIGEMTRRALDWMQQDTEKQAKENKAMQELLHGVISIINDVVADLTPSRDQQDGVRLAASANRFIPDVKHWKELSIDKVDKLVSEWETILLSWREVALDSKKEAQESCGLFQEDCDAKVRQICDLHELERGKRAMRSSSIIALLLHWLIELRCVFSAALTKKILDLTTFTEQQQMLCEDYAGEIWNAAARSQPPMDHLNHQEEAPSSRLGDELSHNQLFLERETMDLNAQLKEAELCSLRWEMVYEDQAMSSRQMEERLGMVLEEAANTQLELQEQKRRVSRMIHIDTLKIYQQKIAFLEDQVHDMQQQVACDHEQFLYEQNKWEYEKKHLGKEVQEIQDVSVKVLKVLLIREKMLKKQERHLQKRSLGFEDWQNLLTDQFNALEAITQELMQECALILVALQEQQTICSRSSHLPTGQNLIPVKPIQIKKMIKRLRKVQRVLETQQRSVSGKAKPLLFPPSAEQSSVGEFNSSRLADQSI